MICLPFCFDFYFSARPVCFLASPITSRTVQNVFFRAPVIREGIVTVSAKYDVIKNANAENVADFFKPPRYLIVFLARSRITRRMIVNKDHRRRAQRESCTIDLARMDQ